MKLDKIGFKNKNSPVSIEQIEELEFELKISLPLQLKEFLLVCNGCRFQEVSISTSDCDFGEILEILSLEWVIGYRDTFKYEKDFFDSFHSSLNYNMYFKSNEYYNMFLPITRCSTCPDTYISIGLDGIYKDKIYFVHAYWQEEPWCKSNIMGGRVFFLFNSFNEYIEEIMRLIDLKVSTEC